MEYESRHRVLTTVSSMGQGEAAATMVLNKPLVRSRLPKAEKLKPAIATVDSISGSKRTYKPEYLCLKLSVVQRIVITG